MHKSIPLIQFGCVIGISLCAAPTASDAQTPAQAAIPYALRDDDQPAKGREGIGLSLSGGAYRAALFHLGALRRLNELGILRQVDEVSSVSGGSLTAAHLATYVTQHCKGSLDEKISDKDWEDGVAKPFRDFASRDLRTAALLKRLLPWNWFKASVEVDEIAQRLERTLTSLKLRDLPRHPDFVLNATDLAFGVDWKFRRGGMGDYLAGYIEPPPADWPLARAVAASNCFPPLFQPMRVPFPMSAYKDGGAAGRPEYSQAISNLRLTDGGNYDNFGLEPIWKNRSVVLVSDGGGALDFEPDKGLVWRILRYPSILDNQARSLHKRWLYASFRSHEMKGAYWRIKNTRATYLDGDTLGYSSGLAANIASIRTDLNGFSEAEAAVLENHGYLLVDAAVKAFLSDLVAEPWPPLKIPHPEWMPPQKSESEIKDALFGNLKAQHKGEPVGAR
jgi:NTE family protein